MAYVAMNLVKSLLLGLMMAAVKKKRFKLLLMKPKQHKKTACTLGDMP